jgi:hypothetical protein
MSRHRDHERTKPENIVSCSIPYEDKLNTRRLRQITKIPQEIPTLHAF